MANEYLQQLEAQHEAEGFGSIERPDLADNPYLMGMQRREEGDVAKFRASTSLAVGANPDEVAKQKKIAEQLGAPLPAVEAIPDQAELMVKLKKIDGDTVNAPALRRKFTDADFARLAHDDSGPLAAIESSLSYLTSIHGRGLFPRISAGIWEAGSGMSGAVRGAFEGAATLIDPLVGTILPANPFGMVGERFGQAASNAKATARGVSPPAEGVVAGGIDSGISSLTQNLLTMPLLLVNPAAGMGAMTGIVGGQGYQDAREAGKGVGQSLTFGASQAAVEYATEKLPVSFLLKDLKAGAPLYKMLLKQVASEIPGEQAATILQDLNEWAVLHPEKPFSAYLEERPSAAAQTLIATMIGVGGNVAVVRGVETVVDRMRGQEMRARNAQDAAAQLEQLVKVASASKLLERDPATFAQFVAEATEGGPVENVYIDPTVLVNTLNQAGVTQDQLPPSLVAQIAEAQQTGADVRIPTSEFATALATQPFGPTLIDNLRTSEDAMTRAEAKVFMQSEGAKQVQQEVERVLAERQGDETFKASRDVVRDQFLEQLNAAKRFTPEVNTAYATMLGNFYAVAAAKMGMTPEDLVKQYQLNITAEVPQGGRSYDQNRIRHDVDRAWRDLTMVNKMSDWDTPATFETTGTPDDFVLSKTEGKQWVALNVRETQDSKGAPAYSSSLEVGSEGFPKGTGIATAMYLQALNVAQRRGIGWYSEGIRSDAALKIYDSLKRAGVPFSEEGGASVISAEDLQGVDLQAVADRTGTLNQSPVPKKGKPGPDNPGVGLEPKNKLGFWPALRVKLTGKMTLPKKALILTGTDNKNAQRQINAIDGILSKFPKATESTTEWSKMMAYAFASDEVPIPPYAFIRDLNGTGSLEKLKTLTQGQIDDASHGFENAAEFRRAYTAGELGVETTGKLFMWSFLSRGVSPYTQESLFIDAFDGADEWIRKAAAGEFSEADFPAYEEWAKSAAPKGSGQPGAGATHNLNAFGQDFLFKMSRVGADGKTHMQRLHDMMSDPNQTGKKIRREFATFSEGVGIDNKVVSFTLLVAGFPDVMVLDRVQIRQLWDDGRFNGVNLYDGVAENKMVTGKDGVAKMKPVKIAGSSLNDLAEGARGILVYEAIERGLEAKIQQLYTELGRPQDASIGRYHWETWVADSQQEASHGTLGAILSDAKGDDLAISRVSAKQGEYGAYEYGALYNRDADGVPWFGYEIPGGGPFAFSVPAFRAFLEDIKKAGTGVVPGKFLVTNKRKTKDGEVTEIDKGYSNGPWYNRPRVNRDRLAERARYWADRAGGSGEGQRALEEAVRQQDSADDTGPAAAEGSSGVLNQPAFHGTPHRGIDKFSTDAIGTGEGAQAYGWGLYFASKKEIAEHYRKTLSLSRGQLEVADKTTGEPLDPEAPGVAEVAEFFKAYGSDLRVTDITNRKEIWRNDIARLQQRLVEWQTMLEQKTEGGDTDTVALIQESMEKDRSRIQTIEAAIDLLGKTKPRPVGQVYEVDVPEDDTLLLWDKPLSEQPEKVREALIDAANSQPDESPFADAVRDGESGQKIYRALQKESEYPGGPSDNGMRIASEVLSGFGIKGIKYLDGSSRYDGQGSYNFVVFSGDDVAIRNTFYQSQVARGQIALGADITKSTSIITLLKGADLSTFIHESGHFFLEVQADLAAKIEARVAAGEDVGAGAMSILEDMNRLLNWFGVEGSPELTPLQEWISMDLEQKRSMHEKFARGFEAYAFEGRAPSLELTGVFQKFRSWMLNVYKQLLAAAKGNVGEALNVQLTDEVRSVMDRMLATTEQIQEAESARAMGPLYSPENSKDLIEGWEAYHELGVGATQAAIDELQARGLKDMQWLQNARSRKLKELQKQHDTRRREVMMEVRADVMAQPIYRAWTFLTGKVPTVSGTPTPAQEAYAAAIDEWRANRDAADTAARADAKVAAWEASPLSKEPQPNGLVKGQFLARNKKDIDLVVQKAMLDWERANPQPRRPDGVVEETIDTQNYGKLALDAVPKELVQVLKALKMTAKEGGMHPDLVAEMFGFSSGDELMKALAEATPPKEEIDGLTDSEMLGRYGEMATPEGIERATDQAIHNDVRAKFVASELRALARSMGVRESTGQKNSKGQDITIDGLAKAAKAYAGQVVARLRVRDIKPAKYSAAEVRAAKAAATAMAKGQTEEAAAAKRTQLINLYATKATYQAQEEVEKAVAHMRSLLKRPAGVDGDYLDQIEQLLERFDLAPNTSLKALDKRTTLSEWVEKQRELGLEPEIPPELLNEAARTSWKNMTVEELRGLRDAVAQIEHLGRLKNRLLTAQDQREFAAAVSTIVSSITDNAGDRSVDVETPNTVLGAKLVALKRFWASHIKCATWARVMDGGKDGGPVWEYLIRSANVAGDSEVEARAKATKDLAEILAPVLKMGPMGGKGQFFPTIGRSINREARFAIALNMGNDGNLQRLLDGRGWTMEKLQPVLDTITQEEWDAVQKIWDYFETFRPAIGAKEKRVYGKEPAWIEPTEVVTKFGTYRGGYYPLKYDPRASERAESHAEAEDAKRQMQGAYTSATTRRSFTKTRVEEVAGRPLLLSIDGIYNGVQEVIHDLSWHEWLIDANRLIRNKAISGAMREHYGPEAHQQFKAWLTDVAMGERGAQNAGEAAAAWLRQGVSVSGLGWNVMSALTQPLGITQSIVRVGPKWVARGIVRAIGSPISTADEINEKSIFMRTRSMTRFRELAEVRSQVKGQGKAREMLDGSAYFLMMRAQQLVDVPTWWGAYEKAISEGNNETRSIALADQAVIDSQGSGSVKDLSGIERGSAWAKLFTTFYSFFNTALNLGVGRTMTEKNKARLAADYLLLFVAPTILLTAMKDALTPGGDDDWEEFMRKLIGEEISYLMGMVVGVREFGGAVQDVTGTNQYGNDYSGPAGLRMVGDAYKLGTQLHQGEMDAGLRKAIISLAGDLARLPAAQVNRTITGFEALRSGETENPLALIFGVQR